MMWILCLTMSASDPTLAARLRGFDTDLSPRTMSALVADPVGALLTIADDSTQPLFVRARAVALVGHYLESRTMTALLRLSRHQLPELRVKALQGMKFFAQKIPATAADPAYVGALSERLADDDRFVRMQAVRVAAVVPSQRSALRLLQTSEIDLGVRHTLDEALR